ncbi:hypothetical protein PVAP13_9KG466000 [Panicum virgatum]|uniref:Uncharacterized protein n=1 Tax=Panicum virgatum TaxID=38727 RepID=A0A8T0NRE0_PANVG|nr:hypothetical protein PVAP13_9KG466000 [Panicum virgatum]
MSATPRGRSSSHRRTRCKCLGGGSKGERGTPCCSFNPLRSLFRCPGGRGRSRSRGKHRQRTPSRVRDAPAAAGGVQLQQGQEEEPSFFVYAMPNQGGFGGAGAGGAERKKNKHRKPRMPSFGSCFRSRKKKEERKQARAAAATAASAPRAALTPASSLLTHPPGSPTPPGKTQPPTPSMTQPPSPAPTENGSTAINSPAPPGRQPAAPRPGKQQPADSPRSPFAPQMHQPKQAEGLENQVGKKYVHKLIVEVATGERLSAHELSLIEMVGSSTDGSAESSVKSSLEYVNENEPPPPAKRTVVEREAEVVTVREVPKLWLNGKPAEPRAGERFARLLVAAEAEELWAHDVACSRVHATMLAETVSSSSSLTLVLVELNCFCHRDYSKSFSH